MSTKDKTWFVLSISALLVGSLCVAADNIVRIAKSSKDEAAYRAALEKSRKMAEEELRKNERQLNIAFYELMRKQKEEEQKEQKEQIPEEEIAKFKVEYDEES